VLSSDIVKAGLDAVMACVGMRIELRVDILVRMSAVPAVEGCKPADKTTIKVAVMESKMKNARRMWGFLIKLLLSCWHLLLIPFKQGLHV